MNTSNSREIQNTTPEERLWLQARSDLVERASYSLGMVLFARVATIKDRLHQAATKLYNSHVAPVNNISVAPEITREVIAKAATEPSHLTQAHAAVEDAFNPPVVQQVTDSSHEFPLAA
jgi:hypothetical protein